MAFANAHYIKPMPYLFRFKNFGVEFSFRKHHPIDFEVHLIPSFRMVYRQGGSVRSLGMSLTFIVWTANLYLFHEI